MLVVLVQMVKSLFLELNQNVLFVMKLSFLLEPPRMANLAPVHQMLSSGIPGLENAFAQKQLKFLSATLSFVSNVKIKQLKQACQLLVELTVVVRTKNSPGVLKFRHVLAQIPRLKFLSFLLVQAV
jgi:hypothetical protein